GIMVPGSGGIKLVGKLGVAEAPGLPNGTKALALFVVNHRPAAETKQKQDEQFIFQVSLQLDFPGGFVPRSNRRGEQSDDWDDRVSDLQFRERFEYGVGHGVSVEVPAHQSPVISVRSTWVPRGEVRRVKTRSEAGVEVRMDELAGLDDADSVEAALGSLPNAYGAWIDTQAAAPVDTKERIETRDELMNQARRAQERIAGGIEILKTDPLALEAFRLTNKAMATAARRRNPERYTDGGVPEWRLFQIAFVLLNVRGIVQEDSTDRNTVELIFFPTGGGKTEAYLGVIGFTLLLRRLHGMDRPDNGYGVAVLLRYTLRLLTLDQLGRAATLICALEKIRQADPKRLGEVRFSVGLWVGKSATANTLTAVGKKIVEYKNSPSKSQSSPFPLPNCPWCNASWCPRAPKPPACLSVAPTTNAISRQDKTPMDYQCSSSMSRCTASCRPSSSPPWTSSPCFRGEARPGCSLAASTVAPARDSSGRSMASTRPSRRYRMACCLPS
ncbi:hypothetical protein ACFL6C_13205, partial [Myxococcota bacterium]